MNDQPPTIEERISARTDLSVAGATEVSSQVGGLSFRDMGQVLEFSKLMSVSRQAIPKHLRSEPGTCMAITLQALNWRMDPFAVANKSYMVNDRIAYEAQLIHAVIEQRAPIKGRIKGRIEGAAATRKWFLNATTNDGDTIEYEGPEIGTITTKNSPLWKADPDQQLWYYSVRAMCRRHFPDVILGVYEKEEIEQSVGMRDITPALKGPNLAQRLAAQTAPQDAPVLDGEAMPPDPDKAPDAPAHWTDVAPADFFPGSPAFTEGVNAAKDNIPARECPYEQGTEQANDWLGGHTGAQRAAE